MLIKAPAGMPANLAEAFERVDWTPDGPYPLGKYDTLRDEYLHGMASEGWGIERSGEVDAPTGWFALMINEPADMAEIADAFGSPVVGIIGNFVLTETSQGFGEVSIYDTPGAARAAYEELETAYSEWIDMDPSEA